jgi:hypothetical protein
MVNVRSPEFGITATGPVSLAFLQRGIKTFSQAAALIKNIPYGRNATRDTLLAVFTDNCGTCSTKHALLKTLAAEHRYDELRQVVGIYRMSAANTPPVAGTLQKHKLSYIPEAHSYFRFHGHIFDYTFPRSKPFDLEKELIEEIEIAPDQVADFKVTFHKQFLSQWLQQNRDIPYTLDELWTIREQCINDLSKK